MVFYRSFAFLDPGYSTKNLPSLAGKTTDHLDHPFVGLKKRIANLRLGKAAAVLAADGKICPHVFDDLSFSKSLYGQIHGIREKPGAGPFYPLRLQGKKGEVR